MEQSTFYCIKLINSVGERGWLYDSPQGIKIIKGGLHADITQFETEKDASNFIRERKLERRGVRALVRTNQDIIEESQKDGIIGVSESDKPMFYLENETGKKCFYDSGLEGYYFKEMGDTGFPIWHDEETITEFVRLAEFEEPMVFLVKMYKGEKQRKLIQAYCTIEGNPGQAEYIHIDTDEWSLSYK